MEKVAQGLQFWEELFVKNYERVTKQAAKSKKAMTRLCHDRSSPLMKCDRDAATTLYLDLVDLCFLKLSTVIDIDRFPFAKYVEHLGTGFAVSVSGGLSSTKWKMDLGTDSG